jgi:hypothetical protein
VYGLPPGIHHREIDSVLVVVSAGVLQNLVAPSSMKLAELRFGSTAMTFHPNSRYDALTDR